MKSKSLLWLVPNMVTFTSIFLGLIAIIWSAQGRYYAAAIALIFASICDLLDGMIARMLGVDSEFGMELDSLADFLSAGVAPAILVYYWSLQHVQWGFFSTGLMIAFIYVLAVGTRLARFNLQASPPPQEKDTQPTAQPTPKKLTMFSGIPSPAGALLLITVVMVYDELQFHVLRNQFFLMPYLLIVSALLVSKIPYRSFKSFQTRIGPFIFAGAILGGLTVLAFKGPGGAILLSVMIWYILAGLYTWGRQKLMPQPSSSMS